MTRIVAVVGMPASGKGVLSEAAHRAGVPVHSMGDVVRVALVARGLEETPSNVGVTALGIREQHGETVVADRLLPEIQASAENHPLVLIEGVRQPEEMAVFGAAFGENLTIIAITAPNDARAARLLSRSRGEDGDDSDAASRDARELGWGLSELISMADWTIVNDSTLASFEADCEGWLTSQIDNSD